MMGHHFKRASIRTLGCRLNQTESTILKEALLADGYTVVPFGEEAELGIINTCTVTREAEAKCRQTIRQFIRKNPRGFTVVMGCYSQVGAETLAKIPGVDLILGNQNKMHLLDYVAYGKMEEPQILVNRIEREDFELPVIGDTSFEKRANLKIQDGCDFMCSFCVIPYARGRSRSRSFENLLEEARHLAARGVKELVLTGVNIGTYRYGPKGILDIIDALNAIDGLCRIRISSIEPTTIPLEIFDRMADDDHALVPYLHLPMQSGCDRILKLMKRHYDTAEYASFVQEALSRVPGLCVGSDIMVGFPGETDDDFKQTCDFFKSQPLAYAHVFPFSERDGTYVMKQRNLDFVPIPVRGERATALRALSARKRQIFMNAYLNKEVEVLFEDPKDDTWPGLTGNYLRVILKDSRNLQNKRARVHLTKLNQESLSGDVLELLD